MTKRDLDYLIARECGTDILGRPANKIKAIHTDYGIFTIVPETPLAKRYHNGVLGVTTWQIVINYGLKDEKILAKNLITYSCASVRAITIAHCYNIHSIDLTKRCKGC